MIQLVAGPHVWTGLAEPLNSHHPRRAAIAYTTSAASSLLQLRPGDSIIIDGSDEVIAAGGVDPEVVAGWLRRGVEVRTLPDLHAKVLLIDAEPMIAIVGSANASAHSRDNLIEAEVITDDPGLCQQLSDQLDIWSVASAEVDVAWLNRARALYRPTDPPLCKRPTNPRALHQPLWLGMLHRDDTELSAEDRKLHDELSERYGDGIVETWRMYPGDEARVRPGHQVILINVGPKSSQPRGDARVWPPATVARVTVSITDHTPVAFLVWPTATEASRTSAQLRFQQIRQAFAAEGQEIDWETPLPGTSTLAAAIRALWRDDTA